MNIREQLSEVVSEGRSGKTFFMNLDDSDLDELSAIHNITKDNRLEISKELADILDITIKKNRELGELEKEYIEVFVKDLDKNFEEEYLKNLENRYENFKKTVYI